ncbi:MULTISPECIES: translational GTPase TypA [Prochlorococcus]|uniref:Large ribosomal subunit assembly factor BipA n=1 Tax=Prochlorococcus marinus (strain SARG / CCMP1375 / SS120) TaxID=167539 RepID=Q7VCA7_PROMA|nr:MULTISPECIES: translational GTPase TypA [Prochlorococcus]AAP99878.1 Predicted membrane GTPase [Prochlorococcus marinus subsp. marinus str. CCMP1375]KGG11775.1 GTP-binding protein TypA/BipA [Prochlorococcus marinus str. LG]KGG18811.1 GTP-binding protein TypA/BipA [Prochlorococcus marinus str. SS2]KGG23651.1 GTP-binding protein TypA/BipA [Prochlorococcus marinus str. SS35]KGG32113.1 GTP-binding protein TypA/BipA [Prochlorococcus marinus str. SS51]
MISNQQALRNIAIVAHVDHGKTTLVDALLGQSGIFRDNEAVPTCVMDSNDLERERGITILSKNTAVIYNDTRINIVDTPGHADFGGEVERVLGMVDGCLLIVDANEGPMPQTRFVLKKALEQGLRPIVFVNKIDRARVEPETAVDKVLDLFLELGADDDQCDFPYLFGSGLGGFAKPDMQTESENMKPLFDAIIRHVPPPIGDQTKPLQLQITSLDYSDFLGRIIIGRVHNGVIRSGQRASLIKESGKLKQGRISKLMGFEGLQRIDIEEAYAGNIVAVSGFDDVNIGETIACPDEPKALPLIKVDEPTLQMTFVVNDSPFAGKEGKFVTSRQLRERLFKELLTNVALRVEETDSPDRFAVCGRGELHLGILIETMRREGYEFQVSQPQVIFRTIEDTLCEPLETLVLDVPEISVGTCIEKLGSRRSEMQNMINTNDGRTQLEFLIPSRGLIGFRGEFIRATRGEGIMSHSFFEYRPMVGEFESRRNGVLISFEEGVSTFYALKNAEDRGQFFIEPGTKVYKGMIIGEHNRQQDLEINICKSKQLTNMRSAGAEELDTLQSPIDITLERALEYIGPGEMLEVTPESIRLRKMPSKKYNKR